MRFELFAPRTSWKDAVEAAKFADQRRRVDNHPRADHGEAIRIEDAGRD